MKCSITGELTAEPVLSTKSNLIFDKKALESYVNKFGKDPITNEPMTLDDTIPVKVSSETSPVDSQSPNKALNSIPSLLSLFQNEWDALVLENFELKKKIHNLEKDLSSSVYHYDASIRVISRLTKERDDAVRKLQEMLLKNVNSKNSTEGIQNVQSVKVIQVKGNTPVTTVTATPVADAVMNDDVSGSGSADVAEVDEREIVMKDVDMEAEQEEETQAVSSDEFRKQISEAEVFLNMIHQKQLKENKSTLNTTKNKLFLKVLLPLTKMDLLTLRLPVLVTSQTILNGEIMLLGSKTTLFIVNLPLNTVIYKFSVAQLAPRAEIVTLAFANVGTPSDPVFKPVCGLDDGEIVVLDLDLSVKEFCPGTQNKNKTFSDPPRLLNLAVSKSSRASSVALLPHPSLNHMMVNVMSNGVWNLMDCHENRELYLSDLDSSAAFEYVSGDLHMDGSLLAMGTNSGLIVIYDMKKGEKLTTFQELDTPDAKDSIVTQLSFMSNGYLLLSVVLYNNVRQCKVNVWDLRKGSVYSSVFVNKLVHSASVDKFNQLLLLCYQDGTVELYKFQKKQKEWVADPKLSQELNNYLLGKNKVSGVYWQKNFDRSFYVMKDNGLWGKYAIDFD